MHLLPSPSSMGAGGLGVRSRSPARHSPPQLRTWLLPHVEELFRRGESKGVEFGDATVRDYDRNKARSLSQHLPSHPTIVYEAHSTDYQTPVALQQLVEDHFAILKVGPWLTFAMREAIFALSEIERNWLAGWMFNSRMFAALWRTP